MSSLNPSFEINGLVTSSADTEFSNTMLNPSHPEFIFNPSNKYANNELVEFLLHYNYRFNEQKTYGIIRPHLDLIESVKSCSEVDQACTYIESFKSALIPMSYRYIQSITASEDRNYNVFDQLRFQINVLSQNQSHNVVNLLNVLENYTRFLEKEKESSLDATLFYRFWNNHRPFIEAAVLGIITTRLEAGDTTPAQPIEPVNAIVSSTQERSKSAGTIVVQPVAAPIIQSHEVPVAHDVDLIKVSEEFSLDEYNKLRNTHRILPIIDELIKSTTDFSKIAKLQIEEFQTHFETYPNASKKLAIDLKARLTLLKHLDKFDHLRNGTLTPQDDFINLSLLQELNNILKFKNLPTILPKKFLELDSLIKVNGDQSLKNALEDLFIQLSFNLAHYLFQHQVDFRSKYRNLDLEDLVTFLNNYVQNQLNAEKLREKTRRFVEDNQSQRVLGHTLPPENARILTEEMIADVLARAANADSNPIRIDTESQLTEEAQKAEKLREKTRRFVEDNQKETVLGHTLPPENARIFTDEMIADVLARAANADSQSDTPPSYPGPIDMESQLSSTAPETEEGVHFTGFESAVNIPKAIIKGFEEGQQARTGEGPIRSDFLGLIYDETIGENVHKMAIVNGLIRRIFYGNVSHSDLNKALSRLREAQQKNNAVDVKKAECELAVLKAQKGGFKWAAVQLVKEVTKQDLIKNVARIFGKLFRK